MVKVMIREMFLRHSLVPRHAQPSIWPEREAASVLGLHKAFQPPNTLIIGLQLQLINRESLQLTRGLDLKRHHGIKRPDRLNAPDDEADAGTTTCRRRASTTVYGRHTGKKS